MQLTTVYRFLYFDRHLGTLREAPDYATEKAIQSVGGTIVPGSEREVPASSVSFSGLVLADCRP